MDRKPEERLTHDVARDVCERLGVKAMIDGRLARFGNNYVMTVAATDCRTGETLAQAQSEVTSSESVVTTLGSMASELRTRLGESLPSIARFDTPIEARDDAVDAGLQGVRGRPRGASPGTRARIDRLLQAGIELDPNFAQAHATLSTVYGVIGELDRSEQHARAAYEHQDRVSERERLFIRYQYHDRVTGNQTAVIETLQTWHAAYPRDFVPANALSVVYNRLGQYDKAVAAGAGGAAPQPQPSVRHLESRRGLPRPRPLRRRAACRPGRGARSTPRRCRRVGCSISWASWRAIRRRRSRSPGDVASGASSTWWRRRGRSRCSRAAGAKGSRCTGVPRNWRPGVASRAMRRGRSRTSRGSRRCTALGPIWPTACVASCRLAGNSEDAGGSARFRAAAALGLAGRRAEALALIAAAEQRSPESTYVQTVLVPVTKAGLALHDAKPADAVAVLEAARSPPNSAASAHWCPSISAPKRTDSRAPGSKPAAEYERLIRASGHRSLRADGATGVARASAGCVPPRAI